MLVMSCFLITVIKCLKGHWSLGSLFNVKKQKWLSQWVSDKVTYWAVRWQLKNHKSCDLLMLTYSYLDFSGQLACLQSTATSTSTEGICSAGGGVNQKLIQECFCRVLFLLLLRTLSSIWFKYVFIKILPGQICSLKQTTGIQPCPMSCSGEIVFSMPRQQFYMIIDISFKV